MNQPILLLGSSALLPRLGNPYSETWPAILKQMMPTSEFIVLAKRRNNTDSLGHLSYEKGWEYGDNLYFYQPKAVVIQIGISDCFPRYLRATSLLNKLVIRMPKRIQSLFWKIYKTFVKRSVKRADVIYVRFCANVRGYLEQCYQSGVKKVIIVPIIAGQKLQSHIRALPAAMLHYNTAYRNIAKEFPNVTVLDIVMHEQDFLNDGMHFNKLGHQRIAHAIYEQLSQLE